MISAGYPSHKIELSSAFPGVMMRTYGFTASRSKEELIDERGCAWRVAEDALVAHDGERLARLGGHCAYWFGWFSFYPQTELYMNKTTLAPR